MSKVFSLYPLREEPVLDIAPNSVRMASCYVDKEGTYHLFVDYIDSSLNTIHSWQAEIRHYRSRDLIHWNFVSTVVKRGKYNKNPELKDSDCYGVGSPDVIYYDGIVYLFYAGRGALAPDMHFNGLAKPGQPGYVSGSIMLACAKADESGSPAGPFKKQGTVIKSEKEWENMRLDDPGVWIEDDTIHLYYKGFNDNKVKSNIKIGYAKAGIQDIKFEKSKEPIISVKEGCEMPRIFKHNGEWNMFLRHFDKTEGMIWRHYQSPDGLNWSMVDANLFDCAGPVPGTGAADMMPVKNLDGTLEGHVLACGMEDGVLKLWLYEIKEV